MTTTTATTPPPGDLRILCCTANMGNAEPTPESLEAWIPKNGALLEGSTLTDGSYDIIAIGMQEATWKRKKASSSNLVGETNEDQDSEPQDDEDELDLEIEPVDISNDDDNRQDKMKDKPSSIKKQLKKTSEVIKKTPELMKKTNSMMMDEFKKLAQVEDSIYLRKLLIATLGTKYELLKEFQRGQMRLYLFAKQELASDEISEVDLKAENTGIGHIYYNKGGIVCTLTIRQTRLSFLTAHLAAHEGNTYYQARNDNVREILRGTKSLGPKHLNGYDVATSSHHMFFMGDLNYRIRLPGFENMEQQDQVKAALEIVKAGDFEKLYSYDELSAGIRKKEMLCQFQTLQCHFNPTFKMLRKEGFQYKEQRVPSYTDRILFTSSEGMLSRLTPLVYEPCPGFITSDHKPIRGAFSIQTNNDAASSSLAGPVRITFSNLKCTDLPVMDVDGSSDPYVKFVWDPIELVKDDRETGKRKTSQSLAGTVKWPVTKYRRKNLNPSWNESVRLCLPEVNTKEINSAMLYLTIMDYDATSQDDTMCTLTLNLQELVSLKEDEMEKIVQIDRPLLKYGDELGRIQCTIDVQRGGSGHLHKSGKKGGFFSGLKKRFGLKM